MKIEMTETLPLTPNRVWEGMAGTFSGGHNFLYWLLLVPVFVLLDSVPMARRVKTRLGTRK